MKWLRERNLSQAWNIFINLSNCHINRLNSMASFLLSILFVSTPLKNTAIYIARMQHIMFCHFLSQFKL